MSFSQGELVDKTIVERRRPHAKDKSRAAVRKLREKAGSIGTNDGVENNFALETLMRHAELQHKSRYALLCLVSIAGYICHLALPVLFLAIWVFATASVCCLILWTSWRFRKLTIDVTEAKKWEKQFLALHATLGICWATIFALYPVLDQNGLFSVLLFAGALVLTGLSLVTMSNLKYGILVTTLPFIAVVALRLTGLATVPTIGMAIVVIAAGFFFQRVGDQIRGFHKHYQRSRAERDELIMQLEDARSISDEARRRAEESNLAKSRFLATMSHELRTPLNAILGFSEVMANEVMGPLQNPTYKEYAGDIHTSGAHLLKLINEILDLSRVEAGRYKLSEEACLLTDIVEEALQMVRLKAAEKSIHISPSLQPDLPQIWADPRALRQIILNILSNALKFTPTGGRVTITCGWTQGGGQYLVINDTGPGIPEDEIPIVLSSFGQGSIAIKSAEQGTGLGLPIVQALVQMHDGKFDLKSKLREGTKVTITFPRKRVLEVLPQTNIAPTNTIKPRRSSLSRRKLAASA